MRWIQTAPSSLGRVDEILVVFDEADFPAVEESEADGYTMAWFEANQAEFGQDLDDDDFPHPVYVLHSSANKMAATISPIVELGPDQTAFSKNVCLYDSALTAHCLALFEEGDSMYIKSGFHYWHAWAEYDGPTSWSTMNLIYDGFYRYLKLDKASFWKQYFSAIKEWEQRNAKPSQMNADSNSKK